MLRNFGSLLIWDESERLCSVHFRKEMISNERFVSPWKAQIFPIIGTCVLFKTSKSFIHLAPVYMWKVFPLHNPSPGSSCLLNLARKTKILPSQKWSKPLESWMVWATSYCEFRWVLGNTNVPNQGTQAMAIKITVIFNQKQAAL